MSSAIEEFEKRISHLEQEFNKSRKEGINKIAEFAAAKFGQNIEIYFPKFAMLYDDFHGFKQSSTQEYELLRRGVRQESSGTTAKIEQIKLDIDKFKQSVLFQQKSITDSPIFVDLQDQVRNQINELEQVKMRIKNMPTAEKMETVDMRFREYISYEQFKDFQNDLPRKFCTQDQAKELKDANTRCDMKFKLFVSQEDLRKALIQVDTNIEKKLAQRVSQEELSDGLQALDETITEKINSFQSTLNTNKNIFAQFNRDFTHIQDDLKYLDEQVQKRMEIEDGDRLWNNFRKFCKFDDLKDLYNKTVPEIQKFEQKIIDFTQEMEKSRIMIRRFDEVISEKASKLNIKEVYQHIQATTTPLTEFQIISKQYQEKLDKDQGRIKNIEEMIDILGKQISKDIYQAVRRATHHLTKQTDGQTNITDNSSSFEEIKQQMNIKVDRQELQDIANQKSNKKDTELSLRWIDIIHKQLKQIAILITEILKQDLAPSNTQTNLEHSKQNTKAFLFQQALLISQWMSKFDSENINEYYDSQQMPSEVEAFEKYVQESLQNVDGLLLSPNNFNLNHNIKLKSKSVVSNKNAPTNIMIVNNRINYGSERRAKSKNLMSKMNMTLNIHGGMNSGTGIVQEFDPLIKTNSSFSNKKDSRYYLVKSSLQETASESLQKSKIKFHRDKLRLDYGSLTAVNSPRNNKESLSQLINEKFGTKNDYQHPLKLITLHETHRKQSMGDEFIHSDQNSFEQSTTLRLTPINLPGIR
ncbi:UNKNOWN [Stylonychia lemnae]|uniref:Uncharacterized protein n=1 Tax=Stylonychia lemnae TaxID=5949 RepID=A0A078B6Q0_STYLE|nr:UNKNOWN [Stylonychia lemnae]|eukprot:CDW89243.1 UNKNOWN [Stylonychia lemnae]